MTKNILKVYLFAVAAAGVSLSASDALKLPMEVKVADNSDPWMDLKNYNENEREQRDAINAIPESSRRLLKYPENNGDNAEVGEETRHTPVIISFRNQDGEFNERLVNYETEKPNRLQRFYKHSDHPPSAPAERIIFPGEDSSNTNDGITTRINGNEGLRMSPRSRNNPLRQGTLEEPPFPNEASKRTPEQYVHSLESLAQIVRHLLFRYPVSDVFDSVTEINPPGRSDTHRRQQEYEYEPTAFFREDASTPESSTSSELDVKEQSLYNGPKLRSSSDCPEGYKRTRNGSCQKPSRRLLTFSR